MKLSKSQWTLGLSLAATLAAVVWVTSSGDGESEAAKPAARGDSVRAGSVASSNNGLRRTSAAGGTGTGTGTAEGSAAGTSVGVQPGRLIRLLGNRKIDDPFSPHSFLPPPPPPLKVAAISVAPAEPPAPPPPPPAPVAPAFPWNFMGRMIDDPQHPQVFLSKNDRLTMVRVGDDIDKSWKLLGMDAKSLRVQYVPLKQVVSVNMAAGSDLASSGASKNSDLNLNLRDLSAAPPQLDAPPAPAAPAAAAPAASTSGVSGIELSSMGSSNNP